MQSQVDSLVPLLYVQCGSLEAATEKVMETLKVSIAAFEISSLRLLDRYFSDPVLHGKLLQFIHGCQCACTANLNWRSVTLHPMIGKGTLLTVETIVSVLDDTSSVRKHCVAALKSHCDPWTLSQVVLVSLTPLSVIDVNSLQIWHLSWCIPISHIRAELVALYLVQLQWVQFRDNRSMSRASIVQPLVTRTSAHCRAECCTSKVGV